jgi:hypothetical protein
MLYAMAPCVHGQAADALNPQGKGNILLFLAHDGAAFFDGFNMFKLEHCFQQGT